MKKIVIGFMGLLLLGVVAYAGWWFTAAGVVKARLKDNPDIFVTRVGGFPGPVIIEGRVSATRLWAGAPQKIIVPAFTLRGFPMAFMDATLSLPQGLYVEGTVDREVFSLDSLELTGPLPLDLPQKWDDASVTGWRDAGGHLTVNHFAFAKGTLNGEGAGTFKLDDKLQPAGIVNVRLNGHIDYLNFLVSKGLVAPRDAMLISTILGGLSSPDEETGTQTMDVGVSLQNRTLYAGPLAVARLPQVYWGNGNQPASLQSPDGE